MATDGASPEHEGLDALLESSPDPGVHTSFAAESGFLLGLAAVLAAPFSVMHAVTLALGGVGAVASFVGVVATGRANVAGRALAPWGLLLSLAALVTAAVRYLGLDTAFGDAVLPELRVWLEDLNARFPQP